MTRRSTCIIHAVTDQLSNTAAAGVQNLARIEHSDVAVSRSMAVRKPSGQWDRSRQLQRDPSSLEASKSDERLTNGPAVWHGIHYTDIAPVWFIYAALSADCCYRSIALRCWRIARSRSDDLTTDSAALPICLSVWTEYHSLTYKRTDRHTHTQNLAFTLLQKLASLDIPDCVYNWLVDYFSGHSHCTAFHGQIAPLLNISASIIQGSAVWTGPVSYVVNAGDLIPLTPGNRFCKYADDTCLVPCYSCQQHQLSNWRIGQYPHLG